MHYWYSWTKDSRACFSRARVGLQYDLASDDGVKMRVWSWANSTSLAIYNIIRPIAKWRFYCFTILAGVFVADFPTDRGMEYIRLRLTQRSLHGFPIEAHRAMPEDRNFHPLEVSINAAILGSRWSTDVIYESGENSLSIIISHPL